MHNEMRRYIYVDITSSNLYDDKILVREKRERERERNESSCVINTFRQCPTILNTCSDVRFRSCADHIQTLTFHDFGNNFGIMSSSEMKKKSDTTSRHYSTQNFTKTFCIECPDPHRYPCITCQDIESEVRPFSELFPNCDFHYLLNSSQLRELHR